MITSPAEYRVGVRNTEVFIDANPIVVGLRRPQTERTSSQGIRHVEPLTLATQKFRIVPMSGLVWDRSRVTPDEGRIDDVTEMIIGMPDADMQMWDYFAAPDGGWYMITHVSPVQGYRREGRLRWVSTEPKSAG